MWYVVICSRYRKTSTSKKLKNCRDCCLNDWHCWIHALPRCSLLLLVRFNSYSFCFIEKCINCSDVSIYLRVLGRWGFSPAVKCFAQSSFLLFKIITCYRSISTSWDRLKVNIYILTHPSSLSLLSWLETEFSYKLSSDTFSSAV